MFTRLLALVAILACALPAAAEVKVVVTLPSLGAVAREVVGDKGTVTVLAPDAAPPGSWSVTTEDTGVNVFMEVRKPGHD